MIRGSRRGRPELNLREQGEGGDGFVHTREGSGSMFNDAMVKAVVTPNRESTDISSIVLTILKFQNPQVVFQTGGINPSIILLVEIMKLQETIV